MRKQRQRLKYPAQGRDAELRSVPSHPLPSDFKETKKGIYV